MIYSSSNIITPLASRFFNLVKSAGGDVYDKQSVNNFLIGLSNIINPSFCNCYSLRSTQNIGNGNTVFGFGGLSPRTGTIINNASWNNIGISANGTNQAIDLAIQNMPIGDAPRSIFIFGKQNISSAGLRSLICYGGTDLYSRYNVRWNGNIIEVEITGALNSTSAISNPTNNHSILCVYSGGGFMAGTKIFIDGIKQSFTNSVANPSTLATTNGPQGIFYRRVLNESYLNGVIAFVAIISVALNDEQCVLLDNLYRSTLGLGLS